MQTADTYNVDRLLIKVVGFYAGIDILWFMKMTVGTIARNEGIFF